MLRRLLFTYLLLTSCIVLAQDFSYGIGGGPTVSTLAEVPFGNPTATQGELGYTVYIFGEYRISERMNIHSKLGIDDRIVRGVFPSESFFSLNYLSLMPSLKIDMGGSNPNTGAFFKPGFRFSTLLSADDITNDMEVSEGFKSTNFGLNAGLGVNFAKHFTFEFLVDFSMSSEAKNSDSKRRINTILLLLEVNIESLLNK